jgi:hypothetical protein
MELRLTCQEVRPLRKGKLEGESQALLSWTCGTLMAESIEGR